MKKIGGLVFNRWQFSCAVIFFLCAKVFGVLSFLFAWAISQMVGAWTLGFAGISIILSLFFGFWNMKEQNKIPFKKQETLLPQNRKYLEF